MPELRPLQWALAEDHSEQGLAFQYQPFRPHQRERRHVIGLPGLSGASAVPGGRDGGRYAEGLLIKIQRTPLASDTLGGCRPKHASS